MNAKDYLTSVGIEPKISKDSKVGRLSIAAEFDFEGSKGVLLKPKRGNVSERYLQLLRDDGVKYVVVENAALLHFYAFNLENDDLIPVRSLPVEAPKAFPTEGMLQGISGLIINATRQRNKAILLGAHLLGKKITKEKEADYNFGKNAIFPHSGVSVKELIGSNKYGLSIEDILDPEAFLQAAALMSGYIFTPKTSEERLLLLEWIGRFGDSNMYIYGLTRSLAFIFSSEVIAAKNVLIATSTLGSQTIALNCASENGTLVLHSTTDISNLLSCLFPKNDIFTGSFLKFSPNTSPDLIVLVPPFGTKVSIPRETLEKISPYFQQSVRRVRYNLEVLYILHALQISVHEATLIAVVPEGLLVGAQYTELRHWMLENIRLLGVMSLPMGYCFEGTLVKCSILFMRKCAKIPNDYPIKMMELQKEDLDSPERRSRVQESIKLMLSPEETT